MIDIIRGEDKTATITMSGLNLTGVTEISVQFPSVGAAVKKLKSDGDVVVTTAASGIFTVTLTDTETSRLVIGDGQAIEIVVDFGANRRIFQAEILNVAGKIFS